MANASRNLLGRQGKKGAGCGTCPHYILKKARCPSCGELIRPFYKGPEERK